MERQCGDTDQRLKKKPNIETVSRGTILKETQNLRKEISSQYRYFDSVVKVMDEIKATWKERKLELEIVRLSKKKHTIYTLKIEN